MPTTAVMPSTGRQPRIPAAGGRALPATAAPSQTPDCLMPVTRPRRPDGAWDMIRWLVAGLAAAPATPASAEAAIRCQYEGETPIHRYATEAEPKSQMSTLRPP